MIEPTQINTTNFFDQLSLNLKKVSDDYKNQYNLTTTPYVFFSIQQTGNSNCALSGKLNLTEGTNGEFKFENISGRAFLQKRNVNKGCEEKWVMVNETIDMPEFINIMLYLPSTGRYKGQYDKLSLTVNKPMPSVALYDPEN